MESEGGPTYAVQPRLVSVWSRWIAREPMTVSRASLAGRTRERIRKREAVGVFKAAETDWRAAAWACWRSRQTSATDSEPVLVHDLHQTTVL